MTLHTPPAPAVPSPSVRRPSTIDVRPDAWAVIGAGTRGQVAMRALRSMSIPVVGFDAALSVAADQRDVLTGHRVLSIDEIEDIDALGVTSQEAGTGTISTDYFAGVIVAMGESQDASDIDFLDSDMLNVHAGLPRLARQIFTPHHPALILLNLGRGYLDSLDQEARVIAGYAALLRDDPRAALAYHRHACLDLLDSLAMELHPERSVVAEEERRNQLAADLLVLGA